MTWMLKSIKEKEKHQQASGREKRNVTLQTPVFRGGGMNPHETGGVIR